MDRPIGRRPCPAPAKAGGRWPVAAAARCVALAFTNPMRPLLCVCFQASGLSEVRAHRRLKTLNILRSSSLFARVCHPSFRHIVRIEVTAFEEKHDPHSYRMRSDMGPVTRLQPAIDECREEAVTKEV
jgi:hypothetical protein